jgi:acyl-CoA thioester hydrolase
MLRIPVAWGDMDALGHVNNTIYLRWFESVRIAWWERIPITPRLQSQGLGPILARTSIDYRRPVKYPDTFEVSCTTLRVGGKSATLSYRVTSSAQDGALVAEGETVVALFDYLRNATAPIDDELRALLLGSPVAAPERPAP